MTEEEVARFALQLREAERIRTMIASEEAARERGGSDEQSGAAVPVEGHSSATVMTSAA